MTDNASSNNTMIDATKDAIPSFPGTPTHTRCFDHIVHLTAKSLLCPFDVATPKEAVVAQNATEASLRELAGDLDLEEAEMTAQGLEATDGEVIDEDGSDNDVEGEFDEVRRLSEVE